MGKHITLVAAALLLAAGPGEASVQAKKVVGWLGAGDWQLRDDGEGVSFAKSPYKAGAEVRHTSWSVSNPAIKSSRGNLLAYDAKGRDPKARLVKEAGEGDATRWSFEAVLYIGPKRVKGDSKLIGQGPSGVTFRVRAFEGPYKGWYLAAKDDKDGKKRLTLVRAKKDATVFKYIEDYYYVRP
jgi:hypothetical protein